MQKHTKTLGISFLLSFIICFFTNCDSLKNSIRSLDKINAPSLNASSSKKKKETNPIIESESFQYKFESISDIKIGNIPFNDQNNVSLALLPKVNALLSNVADSTNLEFMINLNIYNPKNDSILLRKLNYRLLVDQKVLAKDTLVDSLVFSATANNEYPLSIDANIKTYFNSFKDPKDATDALKGFLHLNNREIKTTLLIDSIEYTINNKVFLDIDGTKIRF